MKHVALVSVSQSLLVVALCDGRLILVYDLSLISDSQHAAGLLQGAHRLHHLPHYQVLLTGSD